MEGPSNNDCDSFVVKSEVASLFKFFHALSTFASRPELLIPHIRSTDLDWSSVDENLRNCFNNESCDSLFEYLYSPIFHQGKCVPSSGAGELSGSLYEETIESWNRNSESRKIINLTRLIHHRPGKDTKFGRSSRVEEQWNFINNSVTLAPAIDSNSEPFPYVPFVTLEARFVENEKKAEFTLKRFVGPMVPGVDNDLEFHKSNVLPKLMEWMSSSYSVEPPKLTRLRARPLSFTNNLLYWQCYDLLKSGPAERIKAIWEESTDPVKFIHEDIGIASYIVSFIYGKSCKYLPGCDSESVEILDLGCGNGLLCYFISELLTLFSKSGSVIGYDIRSRKIWKNLMEERYHSNEVKELFKLSGAACALPFRSEAGEISLSLTERTFVPHKMDDLLKRYAHAGNEGRQKRLWIIGNHSDELTPWIPVVSRRLDATGFFIIPCCPYDFFQKYQRRANLPGTSTYQNYIEYVCKVGDDFGYRPALEKLRIPSTKNICLVGIDCSRSLDSSVLKSRIDSVINQLNDGDKGTSISKFVPRTKESAIDSSQVDKLVAQPIVDKIFKLLISGWENSPKGKWYRGREDVSFREITEALSPTELEQLKGKGNGLKTLVKINRNLFTIENAFVKLKVPNETDAANVRTESRCKIRTKKCYFHQHHPHGCPLPSDLCTYLH